MPSLHPGPMVRQVTSLPELLAAVLELSTDTITDDLAQGAVPSWDSLRHLQLVASIEETYGVRLSTREIMTLHSVGDVRAVLRAKDVPV